MAVRDKREVRFSTLYTFYSMYKSGVLDPDPEQNLKMAKANVQYSKHILYQSELPKFAEKYPQVDLADFESFLNQVDGLKVGGKKKSSGEGHQTRLNTSEAAAERGVVEENVARYTELVEAVYAACRELNLMIPNARCSFAIPMKKVKEVSA